MPRKHRSDPITSPEQAKRISTADYDKMVDAYRRHPGQHALVSKEVGFSVDTVKKYWAKGGGGAFKWATSIRDRIETEQVAARSRLRELEEEVMKRRASSIAARVNSDLQPSYDRAKAHADAVDSRVEEGQMARSARRATLGLTATVSKMIKGAAKLSDRMLKSLEDEKKGDVGIETGTRLLKEITGMTKAWAEGMKTAMELERMHLGRPEDAMGPGDVEDVSMEDAVRDVISAQRASSRLIASGRVPLPTELSTAIRDDASRPSGRDPEDDEPADPFDS